MAVDLERLPQIESYVRNYRIDFSIPYDLKGVTHPYIPDFIVRVRRKDGELVHLVLEVKGQEENIDRIKTTAARKWVDAVNNWGKLGRWAYESLKDLTRMEETVERVAGK